ncbi:MAG: hypothetical protein AAGA58_14550 [Verrucomicrobiota bacterium]
MRTISNRAVFLGVDLFCEFDGDAAHGEAAVDLDDGTKGKRAVFLPVHEGVDANRAYVAGGGESLL